MTTFSSGRNAFKCFAAAASVAFLASCQPQQSRVENVADWQFSADSAAWEQVTVPHSYNAADGRTAKYYRGKAYYRRSIELSKAEAASPVYLCFEGAAQQATIYLNGTQITHHKGGYTTFFVDLTGKVVAGSNEVVVVCDNAPDMTLAPVDSDFNKNGGLHNPVSLLVMSDVHFSTSGYGLKRLHVSTPEVTDQQAKIVVEAALCNVADKQADTKVKYTLCNAEGAVVAEGTCDTPATAAADTKFSVDINLENPHLWNGTIDPYLYTAQLELMSGSTVVDKVCTRFGVRYFKMDKDNGFSLNGKPYALRGTSIHQDTDGKATALAYEDYVADYEIVKELGCNFVRLAHYPHNNIAFDLCDSLGLLVQTEIPWVNVCGVEAKPEYFENLHSQMDEMVRSLYNHPSIAFWGIFNEVAAWGNRPNLQGRIDYDKVVANVASLYDLAKSIDPYRYVGLTDCELLKPEAYPSLKTDYVSENRYHGWYYGVFSDFKPAIEGVHNMDKITNVSEYGAGVNPFCHTWNPADINNKVNARHFEEWGNLYHESHLAQIEEMPWLNFTSIWILFDFPVASRKEGYENSEDGVNFVENEARMYTNDKGLVTRDRQLKKDAFYLYKSKWNKNEETVYIANRRLKSIPADFAYTIKVYSNAKTLTLYRGDEKLQTLDNSGEITGVIWQFAPIKLSGAQDTFRVVSDSGKEDTVTLSALR